MANINYPEYRKQLVDLSRQIAMTSTAKTAAPAMQAFAQLHKSGMGEGSLSSRHKELIALGIAIASHCTGCIAFHVHDALKAGATKEEIVETIGVAIVMGGGPAMVYGCEALEALNQYQAGALS